MLARIAGDVRFKEPLSFYTSLRIGGPAEFFIVPQDLDDVRYALAFAAPGRAARDGAGRRQQRAVLRSDRSTASC